MNIWRRRFFWLITAYTIQRALFFGINHTSLDGIHSLTMLRALFDGLRFDLCVIATVNAPIALIHLTLESVAMRVSAGRFRHHISTAMSALFASANIPLIVFGIVDSRLYSFTGRRVSPETFAIAGDIQTQSLGILLQYWYITFPGLTFIAVFALQTWQRHGETFTIDFPPRKSAVLKAWAYSLLAFLAIRGGWQTKPLAPAHAYQWQPASLSNMVLNSGMTLLRSPSARVAKKFDDFRSMEDVKDFLGRDTMATGTVPLARGKNFVVIIVESLASEYTGFNNSGQGYTPFLDGLAKNSIVFRDSFANGRRSIDAMPAIFAGIPAWRNEPFITSPFATNKIFPLPRVMREAGYYSLFFHGAANGSMHFDVFSRMAGFDEYVGRNEYPYKGHDDGQWGIYDEPFLKFAIEKFSVTRQPFLAGIFTLTSHNPFKVPPADSGKFPKGTLPIHESIGYVDRSLATFFKLASGEPWFHNTIFIITGDHTSLSDQPGFNNMPGRFRVPILFFDPSGSLPRIESSKIASHVDLSPTILELAGITQPATNFFGGPLFDRNWRGRFAQEEYETWYLRHRNRQVRIDPSGKTYFYKPADDSWHHPDASDHSDEDLVMESELKALRQYYTNGMIENSWY